MKPAELKPAAQVAHSPTIPPWMIGERIPEDNTLPILRVWAGKGSRVIAYVTPKPCFDDTQQANAELIVQAVNSHASLTAERAQLRAALQWAIGNTGPHKVLVDALALSDGGAKQ